MATEQVFIYLLVLAHATVLNSIQGGRDAERFIDTAPFVSLRSKREQMHECGGVIAFLDGDREEDGYTWGVSAAHCYCKDGDGKPTPESSNIDAYYGLYYNDLWVEEVPQPIIRKAVIGIACHPEYNQYKGACKSTDLLVFKVEDGPHKTNSDNLVIKAMRLGCEESVMQNPHCYVVGFGQKARDFETTNQGFWVSHPKLLQRVDIQVFPEEKCNGLISKELKGKVICGTGMDEGQRIRHGDSGGPLICHPKDSGRDDDWCVAGIVAEVHEDSADLHIFTKLLVQLENIKAMRNYAVALNRTS